MTADVPGIDTGIPGRPNATTPYPRTRVSISDSVRELFPTSRLDHADRRTRSQVGNYSRKLGDTLCSSIVADREEF
jgi:hypothetical protein